MNFDTCNCSCHRSKNCKHIMACCIECDICGRRVRTTANFDKHRAECEAAQQELLNKIKEEFDIK